jgi:uncharacterized protein YndB with AHSA1/START domain
MKTYYILVLFLIIFSCLLYSQSESGSKTDYGAFSFEKELTLPGTPEEIFDAVTGDISGWWDHSVSENPIELFIEPIPGGGFWEIFDEEGNGVLHATVIAADRGKLLRFDGPLGLAGSAIQLVTTYNFSLADNDSTLMKVSVHTAGEMNDKTPAIVESVWDHFIFEQLKQYIESGEHLRDE